MNQKTAKLLKKFAFANPNISYKLLKKAYYDLTQNERAELRKDIKDWLKKHTN